MRQSHNATGLTTGGDDIEDVETALPDQSITPITNDVINTNNISTNMDSDISTLNTNAARHPPQNLTVDRAANGTRNYTIVAGAPQLIRVAGFRDVFERYYNRLDQATCSFGVNNEVDCRCDTLHGIIECDVPRSQPTIISPDDGILVVKAQIAEFETPPLAFKYSASTWDHDTNCLMRSPTVPYDDSTATPLQQSKSTSTTETLQPGESTQPEPVPPDPEPNSSPSATSPFQIQQNRLLSAISREHFTNRTGKMYSLLHQCIAEFIGTMFIVVFGVGSVCSAVLLKENVPLWHIATVWGFGVALAILSTASVSGAHLNPAVSLALAIFRPDDFALSKLLPYWLAQYAGGICGGAFNLMIFGPVFKHFETQNGIIRNVFTEDLKTSGLNTARAFGEYFPAPGAPITNDVISPLFAMFVEAWGTGILMFIILALTDSRQKLLQNKEMIPFYIGFTVAVLITLYAPLTQAGWNPARDFGPRVVAAIAGWGRLAIPGPRNGFWVYIIGPKIGAPVGAFLYDFLIRPGLY